MGGIVRLSIDLDSLEGRVVRVDLTVENSRAHLVTSTSFTAPPYRFDLHTHLYEEGPHTLRADVYLQGPGVGLLGISGAPALTRTVPVVFDQRPPTPLAGLSVSLGADRRPLLRWAPSADANFYAYEVLWHLADGHGRQVTPVQADTLYDRAASSYLGPALPDVVGATVVFRGHVLNRAYVMDAGEGVRAAYGPAPTALDSPSGSAAVSRDGAEVYAVSGTRLVALDAATGQERRAVPLPGARGELGIPNEVQVDPTTGRLYVAYGARIDLYDLAVVDPVTFSVERAQRLPGSIHRFALHDGRLYAVSYGALYVFDAATGAVLLRTPEVFRRSHSEVAAVSADGRSVYVFDSDFGSTTELARVDLSGESFRVAARLRLPSRAPLRAVATPDGRVLIHANGEIRALDGLTLSETARASPGWAGAETPSTETSATALLLAGGRLYAAFHGNTPPFLWGGSVVELDPSTLRRLRAWRFADGPLGLALPPSDRLHVLVPGRAWPLTL